MARDAVGGLVGAVFGLVFVLVNAGDVGAPWAIVLRVLGVVAFVGVVLMLRATPPPPTASPTVARWRVYGGAVVLEVIALVAGVRLLVSAGRDDLALPWVVTVVGIHFAPLAWAFGQPFFHALAAVLVGLGVLSGALALAGASTALVTLLSGVLAGFTLIAFAARPALAARRP